MSAVTTAPDWFVGYLRRGFKLVPFPQRQKGPTGPEAVNWPEKYVTTPDGFRDGCNWGVLLGTNLSVEGEPPRYLGDVDFDWPDGVVLAKRLLPNSSFHFGRGSRVVTHAFFTTDEPVVSLKFEDIDAQVLVELRGTKVDGTIGLQTMLPPSVHPNGEVVELRADEAIGHDAALSHKVALYATACLLFRHLGPHGFKHDARLAVAGLLLRDIRLEEGDVRAVCEAVAEATGNSQEDARLAVTTTAKRVGKGQRVQGRGALRELLGEKSTDVVARIQKWFNVSDFRKDDKGKVIQNDQSNIRIALERLGVRLSFDEFADRMLIDRRSKGIVLLDDAQLKRLWLEMDAELGLRPSLDFLDIVLSDSARANGFHPVRDYLDGLTWDETPRLNRWLIDHGGAEDTDYVRAVSALPLIAAARRVRRARAGHGVKFDELLVIEGEQGLNKSSTLRTLCPDEAWFSEDLPLNVDAKQIIERTVGKWIIEASDLAGMRKSEVELLKATLSRQTDGPVRLAYQKAPTERPRHFVVIGTTNSDDYLKDTTGNRRFWPVKVKRLDADSVRAARDQLWAEAAHREAGGESIRLDPVLYERAAKEQERRRHRHPWEDKLRETFPMDLTKTLRLTPDEVWGALGVSVDRRNNENDSKQVSAILLAMKFVRKTVRNDDGVPVWGWVRYKKDTLPLDE